jgi:hypothetical protein
MSKQVSYVYKSGRAWNGAHRDAGTIIHIIDGSEGTGFWGGKAYCGTEPGRRSNGWEQKVTIGPNREVIKATEATCQKCIDKYNKLNQIPTTNE